MSEEIGYSKILITGAAGQLGQILIKKLLNYNTKIIALDRLKIEVENENITPITVDLTKTQDIIDIKDEIQDVDYLIHLAAVVKDSNDITRDADLSINTEILGTLTLLKYLTSLKGITYSSSYMVYGPPVHLPIDEKHPTNPINIYGVCKLAAEKFLQLYGEQAGIPVSILRFSGIYGPGTHLYSNRLIPALIRTVGNGSPPVIFGKGTERREGLYIDDAVSAIIKSVQKAGENVSGTFNISAGTQYNTSELAELIIELFHKPDLKPQYEPGSAASGPGLTDLEIDISPAKKQLGFEPEFNLKDGLKNHINWYLEKTKG